MKRWKNILVVVLVIIIAMVSACKSPSKDSGETVSPTPTPSVPSEMPAETTKPDISQTPAPSETPGPTEMPAPSLIPVDPTNGESTLANAMEFVSGNIEVEKFVIDSAIAVQSGENPLYTGLIEGNFSYMLALKTQESGLKFDPEKMFFRIADNESKNYFDNPTVEQLENFCTEKYKIFPEYDFEKLFLWNLSYQFILGRNQWSHDSDTPGEYICNMDNGYRMKIRIGESDLSKGFNHDVSDVIIVDDLLGDVLIKSMDDYNAYKLGIYGKTELIMTQDKVNKYIADLERPDDPSSAQIISEINTCAITYVNDDEMELHELTIDENGNLSAGISTYSVDDDTPFPMIVITDDTGDATGFRYSIMLCNDIDRLERVDRLYLYGPDGSFRIDRTDAYVFIIPIEYTGLIDRIIFIDVMDDGYESHAGIYDMDISRMSNDFILHEEKYLPNGTRIYGEGNNSGRFSFDLDEDGTLEEIMFYYDIWSSGFQYCYVTIDGTTYSIRGDNIQTKLYIVDIDTTTPGYQLMLAEEGPSSDYFTFFHEYRNKELVELGTVGGLPDFGVVVEGDGTVKASNRGSILHTWFYDATYVIEDNKLVEKVEDGLYWMGWSGKALAQIPLQVSIRDTTPSYTVQPGDKISITWTDNIRWICIRHEDGREGWIDIRGETYESIGKPDYEIFEGLCYAD